MKLAIAYDDVFLDHIEHGHPERPERLVAIRKALESEGFWRDEDLVVPREATEDELATVHDRGYVRSTLRRLEEGHGHLDPDTYFSPGSRKAALMAAGGGIELARAVWKGNADVGLALVRPPGHHAEARHAAGFCIFNNIAIAASALLADGAQRVLVFDWDVHHGNGTQHQFESRSDLFYISVHAWPHYPGTGLTHEVGKGKGAGYTANVPFPHGATDAAYAAVVDELVAPIARAYDPDIVLISAGFDAHQNDYLGGMSMTEGGYGYLAKVIRDVASETCRGKIVLFLEGGYDLQGISASIVEVLKVFAGADAQRPTGEPGARHRNVLDETLANLRPYWPSLS